MIKKKTQCAIRVLLFLSRYHSYVNFDTLCKATELPRNQLKQMLSEMQNASLVISCNGCKGGYRLGRTPVLISLYDVVEAMEDPLDDGRSLSRDEEQATTAEEALQTALQQKVTGALKCVALGDYADFPQSPASAVVRPWLHGLSPRVHINPIGYDTYAASQMR